jgi:hypothetical protein
VDVDALLARLPSRLLTEWMAYYGLEPFGEERADLRSAIVASLVANANRDPAKRREPFTPQDFMPKFDRIEPAEQQAQSWERQKAIMQSLFKPKR